MRRGQVNWLFDRPCSLGDDEPRGNRNRWGFKMVFRRLVVGVLSGSAFLIAGPTRGQEAGRGFRYPDAPRSETVEDYHGTKVADPYRPLEDPDAQATRAVGRGPEQDHLSFLEAIPQRGAIRKRLTELWDYEKFTPPRPREGTTFSATTRACRTRACSTRPARSTPSPGSCSTRIRSRRTGPSRWPGPRSARTASCWLTVPPRRARTGTSGGSATWPPRRTWATT